MIGFILPNEGLFPHFGGDEPFEWQRSIGADMFPHFDGDEPKILLKSTGGDAFPHFGGDEPNEPFPAGDWK